MTKMAAGRTHTPLPRQRWLQWPKEEHASDKLRSGSRTLSFLHFSRAVEPHGVAVPQPL